MRRDRKIAQKKKQREAARSKARASASNSSRAGVLKVARGSPLGPAYMSREWRDDSMPVGLVSVVLTRALPNGLFFPMVLLIDRTCLGVKSAFVADAMSQLELTRLIDRLAEGHPEGVELVDAAVAQSVVFAAVDYAASLGFKPDRDFDPTLAGPRPAVLEATPLARPARPFYVADPDDDVGRVVATLRSAVGTAGFDVGEPEDDEWVTEVEELKL